MWTTDTFLQNLVRYSALNGQVQDRSRAVGTGPGPSGQVQSRRDRSRAVGTGPGPSEQTDHDLRIDRSKRYSC